MTDPVGIAAALQATMFGVPLAELWFALIFAILGAFLLLDGFDFGIGVLFALRDDHEERETLLAAMGPFWDGNEVWLVVFGGSLFAVFPAAYASLFGRHYLLMFAILLALILRGLAPEFYEQREDAAWQRWWGYAFVAGSAGAPFLLGIFAAHWAFGIDGLASLPGVLVGLALVALSVADAAAFLGMKTRGTLPAAAGHYGTRAMAAYVGLVVLALGTVAVTRPELRDALLTPPVLATVALTLVAAVGYLAAMRAERFRLAFVAVAGLVAALVGVVGLVLYPAIDPVAGLTVADAVVGSTSLTLMTVAGAVLLPLVLVYFAVLYSAFRGPIEAGETY